EHGTFQASLIVGFYQVAVGAFPHRLTAARHSCCDNWAAHCQGFLGTSWHPFSVVGGQHKYTAPCQPGGHVFYGAGPGHYLLTYQLIQLGLVDGPGLVIWCTNQDKFGVGVSRFQGFCGIHKIAHTLFWQKTAHKDEPHWRSNRWAEGV